MLDFGRLIATDPIVSLHQWLENVVIWGTNKHATLWIDKTVRTGGDEGHGFGITRFRIGQSTLQE